jgi:hypothetical protein
MLLIDFLFVCVREFLALFQLVAETIDPIVSVTAWE